MSVALTSSVWGLRLRQRPVVNDIKIHSTSSAATIMWSRENCDDHFFYEMKDLQ